MRSNNSTKTKSASQSAEVDLIVVGSGAAGLTSALIGRLMGLEVLVLEKDTVVGGTTAISGGGLWTPCSPPAMRMGIQDSLDNAMLYFKSVTKDAFDPVRAEAFLNAGPELIAFLEDQTEIRFSVAANRPDYYPDLPGATQGGRCIFPTDFDGRRLGRNLRLLKPPARETTFMGIMMRPASDLRHFLNATRSFRSLWFVAQRMARQAVDLAIYGRSMTMAGGNALIAHLLNESLKAGVIIKTSMAAKKIVVDNGHVNGVICTTPEGQELIMVRKGVILAAGGFPHDVARRAEHYHHLSGIDQHVSPAPKTNTGDGMRMAEDIGGYVPLLSDAACWAPVSIVPFKSGKKGTFPHLIDRQKPGFIAVTPDGHRFVNESHSYHEFGRGLLAACGAGANAYCFLIADHKAVRRYGMGFAKPAPLPVFPYLRSGYLVREPTIEKLAARLGIDPLILSSTIQEFNIGAREGKDAQFHRGTSAYNKYLGDISHKPNPCVAPIEDGPYYAVKIHMGELGTFSGVATNENAQVLARDGSVIPGLYAAGNDMSHVMGGNYIGGGSAIGPAMTFGYIAARHLASGQSTT